MEKEFNRLAVVYSQNYLEHPDKQPDLRLLDEIFRLAERLWLRCDNHDHKETANNDSVYVWFMGNRVEEQALTDSLLAALGFRMNPPKDGAKPLARYDHTKGAALTTYLYERVLGKNKDMQAKKDKKRDNEVSLTEMPVEVADNREYAQPEKETEEEMLEQRLYDFSQVMADFSRTSAAKKGKPYFPLFYSMFAINSIRQDLPQAKSPRRGRSILNALHTGYCETMMEAMPQTYAEISTNAFSEYARRNECLYTRQNVELLMDRSIAVYLGVTAPAVSRKKEEYRRYLKADGFGKKPE